MCAGPLPMQHAAALCVNAVPAAVGGNGSGSGGRRHFQAEPMSAGLRNVRSRLVARNQPAAAPGPRSGWSLGQAAGGASHSQGAVFHRRHLRAVTEPLACLKGSSCSQRAPPATSSHVLAPALAPAAQFSGDRSKPSTRTSHSQRGQRSARLQGVTATAGGASGGGAPARKGPPRTAATSALAACHPLVK